MFQAGSWLVWEAVKYFLAEQGNTEPFWVGKWEDVEANIFLSDTISWADGGKDGSGSCVVSNGVKLELLTSEDAKSATKINIKISV